jgi:MFS transporter, DHA3 family, macrolide efflux protein
MRAFLLLAFGQFISLTGSAMTAFALSIWAWEKTGEATALALVGFFSVLPLLLLSPIAGALVDRWDRKLTMMLSDLGAGVATIGIFLLYNAGQLEIWHIYVSAFIAGAFQTFQWPAYSAAISLMVRKDDYTRANALFALAESASVILAPSLAATLLTGVALGALVIPSLGLGGIMTLDIVSFLAAIGTLLVIRVPNPERSLTSGETPNLWREMKFGFSYIFSRKSLLGLQLLFMGGNFFWNVGFTLIVPYILSRTNSDEGQLGLVQSVLGVGGVIGGLILSAWGGPRRKVLGVVGAWLIGGALVQVLYGVGTGLVVWIIGSAIAGLMLPLVNSSNQSIWQSKVPPEIQGKVFSARRMIAWLVNPLAALIAGPLADRVMEPAFAPGGALVPAFGWLVGSGRGAGMGFIMVLCGLAIAGVMTAAYSTPAIRNAETLLPDHDAHAP